MYEGLDGALQDAILARFPAGTCWHLPRIGRLASKARSAGGAVDRKPPVQTSLGPGWGRPMNRGIRGSGHTAILQRLAGQTGLQKRNPMAHRPPPGPMADQTVHMPSLFAPGEILVLWSRRQGIASMGCQTRQSLDDRCLPRRNARPRPDDSRLSKLARDRQRCCAMTHVMHKFCAAAFP